VVDQLEDAVGRGVDLTGGAAIDHDVALARGGEHLRLTKAGGNLKGTLNAQDIAVVGLIRGVFVGAGNQDAGQVGELGGVDDGLVAGEAVRGDHDHVVGSGQKFIFKCWRELVALVGKIQIQVAITNSGEQLGIGVTVNLDFNLGKLAGELGDGLEKFARPKLAEVAQLERVGLGSVGRDGFRLGDELVDLFEKDLGMLVKVVARGGQLEAAAFSLNQGDAQTRLELLDSLGEGGLGQVAFDGGLRVAVILDNGNETFDLTKHDTSSFDWT